MDQQSTTPQLGFNEQSNDLGQFLLTEAARYSSLRELFALSYDVEGGLQAKQYGVAVHSARIALHVAVDLALTDVVGSRVVLPGKSPFTFRGDHTAWLSHQWPLVRTAWGAASNTVSELWEVETYVPIDDAASISYVNRCKEITAKLTGLRLEVSIEALRDLLRRFYDSAELLAACGYAGRDKLFVFGSAGYKQAGEVRLYDYVDAHLRRLGGSEETS